MDVYVIEAERKAVLPVTVTWVYVAYRLLKATQTV